MKYKKSVLLALSTALLATTEVRTISEAFSEAKTSGNVRYYYIQTDKDQSYTNSSDTSAYANSLGGQLSIDTATLYSFTAGATFMTTNPFLLAPDVDTSIIGKDNGARGGDSKRYFSVLGEGYLSYNYEKLDLILGRKVIKTPLIHAKDVRMLPSSVAGFFTNYKLNSSSKIELAYLDKFKQRTSDFFVNIVEHALGSKSEEVTGSRLGSVIMAGVDYNSEDFHIKFYDYYSNNFMNSAYLSGTFKLNVQKTKIALSAQYIKQSSIGKADTNLAKTSSITAGKSLESNAVGLKASVAVGSSMFYLAYSNVFKNDGKHDSLVLPWDGTPLYASTLTSNNLFQSVYGAAFKADSTYIGGSEAINFGYAQKYDKFGLEGVSSKLLYMNIANSKFQQNQQDFNVILSYKPTKALSFDMKGIWSQNASGSVADGTVSQLKLLTQYRVIANYKF